MRLGVNVPNFGPGTTPESLLGWVRFAESAGFSLAVMSDHVAPTPEVTAIYPSPFYDPFTALAWLAGQTDLWLGTSVTVLPYRHPLVTARLASNLDQLTGGRFVLGVGVGWAASEFDAIGVPFDRRGAITDEYLAVILDAWAAPETSFEGAHVRFPLVDTGPAPVQVPHPPLWVGGAGTAALERAARFSDAWHAINPDRRWLVEQALPTLADAAARAGRTPPAFTPRIKAHVRPRDVGGEGRPLGVGSLSQIRDDVAWLADLGAEVVVLDRNPDHPDDRRSATEDWDALQAIVDAVAGIVDRPSVVTAGGARSSPVADTPTEGSSP